MKVNITEQILDAPTIEDAVILWLESELVSISDKKHVNDVGREHIRFENSARADISRLVDPSGVGKGHGMWAKGIYYGSFALADKPRRLVMVNPHPAPRASCFRRYSRLSVQPDEIRAYMVPRSSSIFAVSRVIWRKP